MVNSDSGDGCVNDDDDDDDDDDFTVTEAAVALDVVVGSWSSPWPSSRTPDDASSPRSCITPECEYN